MIFASAVLLTAGALLASGQAPTAPRPLVQLIQDLDSVTARAHLTDGDKQQFATDRAVLEKARIAKEQGAAVDRRQVAGAVKSIRQTIESGPFSTEDKQTIAADIDRLRRQ